ncbi:rab18-family small GTPase [Cyclospora cayetanensis]|uniref:Rab18-family small GTPase n=1 Tax=Cyclospora cayetanensis TaxID=88456 RepID=A0A1D3CZ46_9EIME|nr:rab18-family small GTPase [Cyclospora cayetanensis]
MAAAGAAGVYDHLLKLLLIGDSGVGKSSLLLRFAEDKYDEQQLSTIGEGLDTANEGVDKQNHAGVRFLVVDGVRLKLAIWDTAGQERFRTLTSSYYRGAQGIILVYDVGCRETFENCSHWLQEAERHGTVPGSIKMIVANKVDTTRVVSTEEGRQLAAQLGTLFVETSAKTSANVQKAFEELVTQTGGDEVFLYASQILATPSLLTNTQPISSSTIAVTAEDAIDDVPGGASSCSC